MAVATLTAKLEDVVRDAITPGPAPCEHQHAWLGDAAACVQRHGGIVIRDAIPQSVISAVLEDFRTRHDVHMAPGQKKLFRTFQSDPLRAQVPVAVDGPVANPEFFAPPSVLALARKLMGDDLIIGEMGVVISHAGAGAQEIHRNSDFLFGGLDLEIDLPPYAMTMLVPLLDITPEMGPTEFWPGTHRLRAETSNEPPLSLAIDAGSVILIDSRVLHRGGANVSGPVRPTAYFSFHRPWYLEQCGYENKPQVRITPAMLQRLPEAYRSMFSWALHLNRTDTFHEFVYRWTGRIRQRLLALRGP